jgi:PAS domain-containing protein
MSSLPVHVIHPERLVELRSRAASRLAGAAGTKGATARAADALTVLHTLASTPATASDALTLLHELQVHQVEVELQAQELHESRAELEAALQRQTELYDHQPAGCFTIDPKMVLHELNQTGADLLGLERDDAFGWSLDSFMSAESARRFRSAVASLDAGRQRATGLMIKLCPKVGPEVAVLASIGVDPAAKRYIVNLTNAAEDPEQPNQTS